MKLQKSWVFILGIFLGASIGIASVAVADKEIHKVTVTTTNNASQVSAQDVQRFSRALQQIKAYYVKPISDDELFDNAIRGMLSGLDPHSNYLDNHEFKELTDTTKGEFSGIGLEITLENDALKVVTPIDDSPAAKAGVKPGDIILAIDNTPVSGLTLSQAVQRMRGAKGSKVVLTVARKGENKALKLEVIRDVIQVHSVKAKLLDHKYGYVKINSFQLLTADDLIKAITKLNTEAGGHLNGLVLDLRNNPGGLLDSAIEVSDAFLDSKNLKNKLIVFTKGRTPNANFEAKASSSDILHGAPMVVLINGGSASAAEIVAAAMQDQKRAVLVGTRSFGKGSVQTVLPLDEYTGIKLTTALYYTPSGRSIQAQGVVPDVVVDDIDMSQAKKKDNGLDALKEANLIGHINNTKGEVTSPDFNDSSLAFVDPQLNAALNILKGLAAVQSISQPVTQFTEHK